MDTDTKPTRRRYTDEEQAHAMAVCIANGGNTRTAADITGIPEPTIRHWKRGDRRQTPSQLDAAKAALADRVEGVVESMLDILEAGIEDIKPSQAAIIMGIGIEKMLLLRGEATTITATQDDSRLALFRANYGKLHTITDATTAAPQPTAEPGPKPDAGEITGKQGDS